MSQQATDSFKTWVRKKVPIHTAPKPQSTLAKGGRGDKEGYYKITLLDLALNDQIYLLRDKSLIGRFYNKYFQISVLRKWAFQSWEGINNIFYIDKGERLFIAIFASKFDRDRVHSQKDWFCEGEGLTTLPWVPNFNSRLTKLKFSPIWVSFPTLMLEFRDIDLIETFANQMGIFIKHDLIPFEHIKFVVRVYLLVDLAKLFPKQLSITSKFGT